MYEVLLEQPNGAATNDGEYSYVLRFGSLAQAQQVVIALLTSILRILLQGTALCILASDRGNFKISAISEQSFLLFLHYGHLFSPQ